MSRLLLGTIMVPSSPSFVAARSLFGDRDMPYRAFFHAASLGGMRCRSYKCREAA